MASIHLPWHCNAFDGWSIVGMNHYHVNGEKMLFVSMEKNDMCIKQEGKDDEQLWVGLSYKALEKCT